MNGYCFDHACYSRLSIHCIGVFRLFSLPTVRAYVWIHQLTHSQAAFQMPFTKDKDFVGREELLARIDELLEDTSNSPRAALVGLGGVG